MNSRVESSAVKGSPSSVTVSARARLERGSESTRTPSQSRIRPAGSAGIPRRMPPPGGFRRAPRGFAPRPCDHHGRGSSSRSGRMSTETETQDNGKVGDAKDTLTITDNRTGKTYEVEITDETIRAMDLRQIKVHEDDFGMMAYDPAFTNTASCRSEITYIDGAAGVLEYRGYPIEQLCEHSNYLEVAYLLIYGQLPTQEQYDAWTHHITIHTYVHENVKSFMEGFRYDAHPMGMLLAATGALSTFYPEANDIKDEQNRDIQIIRLLAKVPTLAAFAF